MPYITEITIAAIIAAGFLIYLIRPKYKDRKLLLLVKYRRVRTKSLLLQDQLSKHVLLNDAVHQEFMPGISYGEFMKQFKKTHSNYISEKTYIKLKNSSSIFFLNKIDRILDEQEEQLIQVEKKLLEVTSASK